MKKIVMTGLGTLAAAGLLSTTAMANVDVTGSVTKDKDVAVFVDVFKTKDVSIDVRMWADNWGSAAQADALANVTNTGNTSDKADLSTLDGPSDDTLGGDAYGRDLQATMDGSASDNTGVVGINQDVGAIVNQGNIVAVAAVNPGGDPEPAFTHSAAAVDQLNADNTVVGIEEIAVDEDGDPIAGALDNPNRQASINNSGSGNAGIVGINQNAGNMNNQTNAVALSVGLGAALALSEADLGQENTGNHVTEFETVKVGRVDGSFNNNTGIVQGNQSTGNMNNQGNAVAFSALTSTASIGVPGS